MTEHTDDAVWSYTDSNPTLWHAFDGSGRALCNRRIRPRAGEPAFFTRQRVENFPMARAHDRCVHKLAERAEAERLAGSSMLAAAADQLARTVEAVDAERERRAAQRVVEGVVVEHNSTAEGSAPKDATHPDVVAARASLKPLKPATLTDDHDVSEPDEAERGVRGYVVDPRGHGRVAVYWLEGGRVVRRDEEWHGPSLDWVEDKLRRSGWKTERMLRSSACVFAWRPEATERQG